MTDELFKKRLIELRIRKGVSAREMSLGMGQSESYINKIENTAVLPSMNTFFYICDYFKITPAEFFDLESAYPEKLKSIVEDLKRLDDAQLDTIAALVKNLSRK